MGVWTEDGVKSLCHALSWLRCRSAIKAARCTAAVPHLQECARALHARLSAANSAVRQCERDVRRGRHACRRTRNVVTEKSCNRTKFARPVRAYEPMVGASQVAGGSCASHVSIPATCRHMRDAPRR